jgi:hypothetical protein
MLNDIPCGGIFWSDRGYYGVLIYPAKEAEEVRNENSELCTEKFPGLHFPVRRISEKGPFSDGYRQYNAMSFSGRFCGFVFMRDSFLAAV